MKKKFAKTYVFGVGIDDVSMREAVSLVEKMLKDKKKHYIVTPNPEFIMLAQKDEEFKEILNKADLAIPDGSGLRLTGKIHNRTTGTDLVGELSTLASKKGYTVGFLGGREGVAKKAAERLLMKYPGLNIVFAESGPKIDMDGNAINDEKLKMKEAKLLSFRNESKSENHQSSILNLKSSDILFVAFGQGKQEKWIAKNLDKIPVKVAIGVGGALDYISGEVPRAPKLVRNLGFEWLFRLLIQPWRIKRQINLIKFFFKSVLNF